MGKSRVVWAPCGEEAVRWNNADSNTAGYSRYKDDPLHVLEASIDLLELGRRIRCAREINGRSQEAFADVCRLDRSYFGEIERGEPGRSLFLRGSRLLTRSVDDGWHRCVEGS